MYTLKSVAKIPVICLPFYSYQYMIFRMRLYLKFAHHLKAPEVNRSAPYNSSADVYSFAILLWEMLALRTPFEHYTKEMHKDIVINKGFRPHIERNWSDRLASILTLSWSKDIQDRLTFKAIGAAIREEIRVLINGDECLDMLVDFSNRTAKSDCRRGQEISSPANPLQGC